MSEAKSGGWFSRLKAGLSRTSAKIAESINTVLGRATLDDATLAELEDALIAADLGPRVAARLVESLRKEKFEKGITDRAVREALARSIAAILQPVAQPFAIDARNRPEVLLIVGVNGSGKTTTIGKLAKRLIDQRRKVVMAAGDTFRAAAVSQLKVWGERVGATVVTGPEGGDPAALAFTALERARSDGADALLIDTAGRLHNKADLMAELAKVVRVIRKLDPATPHQCLLVLDATTGQNALQQVEIFKSMVNVTGLVVTKLDGSARGGILVALAERFGVPVVAIGVGETIDDLNSFIPEEFARSLLDLA